MIIVRFLGGTRKSFQTDSLELHTSDISVNQLLDILFSLKPPNTLKLDNENILIAINGIDSSAIDGKMTVIKNNDVVSIIPIIHGGSQKQIIFSTSQKIIQILEVSGKNSLDISFIDDLRKRFSKLKIQAISSSFVLGLSHCKKIISLSLISQKNNTLISNKLETDILIRFALTSQISESISIAGLKPSKDFILIAIGNTKQLNQLYAELQQYLIVPFSKHNAIFLKKEFKISKKQLDCVLSTNPLEDLLAERAATLF